MNNNNDNYRNLDDQRQGQNNNNRNNGRGQQNPLNADALQAQYPAYAGWGNQDQAQNLLDNQNNQDVFGQDGQPLRRSEIAQQEIIRREQTYKKQVDSLIGEMVYAVMIMLCIAGFVIANKGEQCDAPIRPWLAVTIGSYLVDFILLMIQFHFLKKNKKDNLFVMAVRFVVLCFLTGWLIYGNVIYYKQNKDASVCSNGLKIIMFLVLLIGYFEMLKCCCIGMVVCIMIPFLFFAVRRAQRPNWVPAAPQFVQNLYKTRFNPQQNQAFDQCAICLLDFNENDEIIPLPCDEKHYFHPDCIKQWLTNNNNCPLCKKAITKEALKEQKKRHRGRR